ITPEMVDFVAQSAKFLPHFHIPLQSGSNRILALMRRRYRRELFAERIELIRSRMPDTFFGVDVIVGFPGETDDDFSDAYRFIEQVRPSSLHIFPYSERPNTPAAEFDGKVNPSVVRQRVSLLTDLSDKLHNDFYLKHIGQTRPVLVESSRKGDYMFGFADNYIKVGIPFNQNLAGKVVAVKLEKYNPTGFVEGSLY
ncbi:MAG: radical SAM protein, partial [Bacteroidales bacterium]|nr:radical SAM protein [Bacteroidales bacterium]